MAAQERQGSILPTFLLMVLLNSAVAICMRNSRLSQHYVASTAVLASELIKFAISLVCLHSSEHSKSFASTCKLILKHLTEHWDDWLKVAIPSGLYVLQNNLQYVAASNLPAQVYQVVIQMKIVVTALLSVIFLRNSISPVQWLAIVAATLGVSLVQYSLVGSEKNDNINATVGIISVLLSCLTSGFAGVYFEYLIKTANSFWMKNIQMTTISIAMAAFVCFKDLNYILDHGFFVGYTKLVWTVILLQAVGGLLVSVIITRTNSIVKGFANSAAIVFSCVGSWAFTKDFEMTSLFLIGALITCISTYVYTTSKIVDPVSKRN